MFREIRVHEVVEMLRRWQAGQGLRTIEAAVGVDRKTVRRYVDAAVAAGLTRGATEVDEAVVAQVVERVRPHRPDGHGHGWAGCVANHDRLKRWLVDEGLTVVKAGELLAREGTVIPARTLHRYALEVLGVGRTARRATMPVADGEPGSEVQVDFGKMGFLVDPDSGRRRVVHALIFTAVFSRHCYVWLTHTQTTADVIEGCEAAWRFFGGVFKVMIPDNLTPVVARADRLEPRLGQAFAEYAQARGSFVDPARVRTPTDKPRVERMVQFVRGSFFAGETFIDLADAQRRAEAWCAGRAGMRIHGTHQARPAELFALTEAPCLLPAPERPYDVPVYARAKVHRDHHVEIARALYSVPGSLIGCHVDVRADAKLVRISHRGQLIKVHPRQPPGRRSTHVEDLPAERTVYAMRDLDALVRMAAGHGPAVGAYATALLDHPLPWTKMRQVYALLGLVKRHGPGAVDQACARALEAEAVNVGLIGRMLERATPPPVSVPPATAVTGRPRFARADDHFAVARPAAGGQR